LLISLFPLSGFLAKAALQALPRAVCFCLGFIFFAFSSLSIKATTYEKMDLKNLIQLCNKHRRL